MFGVKLKLEVNTEQPGQYPAHIPITPPSPPSQVQPPWQGAETDISAMSQETAECPHGGRSIGLP